MNSHATQIMTKEFAKKGFTSKPQVKRRSGLRLRCHVMVLGGLLFTMMHPGDVTAENLVVEDFESYLGSQVLGADWQSQPWARFGPATIDNVVAVTGKKVTLSGSVSGQYSVAWPARYGAVRRVYNEPIDLTRFSEATVTARSDTRGTKTHVKVAVSNGTTTFSTVSTGKLTDETQTFTFSILAGKMVRSDGDETFVEVIQNARLIGLDFISGVDAYSETIRFDDFVLIEPDPDEEGSADVSSDEKSDSPPMVDLTRGDSSSSKRDKKSDGNQKTADAQTPRK